MEKLTRHQVVVRLKRGEKDFRDKDLRGLDLSGLNLSGIDLSYTRLDKANLYYANLSNTNLFFANLFSADLDNANLENANLKMANLIGANLLRADLTNANLTDAELDYANLCSTKLSEKEQIRKGIILKEAIRGYKKCMTDIIVTLEIPKGANVFSINNSKCRTNKARVIEISDGETMAVSQYDENFIYEVGKEIEIEDFDLIYNIECSTGIHFFRTREEAEDY